MQKLLALSRWWSWRWSCRWSWRSCWWCRLSAGWSGKEVGHSPEARSYATENVGNATSSVGESVPEDRGEAALFILRGCVFRWNRSKEDRSSRICLDARDRRTVQGICWRWYLSFGRLNGLFVNRISVDCPNKGQTEENCEELHLQRLWVKAEVERFLEKSFSNLLNDLTAQSNW